jgi:hypothetical protein
METAVVVSEPDPSAILDVIPPDANKFDHVPVPRFLPVPLTGVTVKRAFSPGAYDALSNANLKVATDSLETVTVISFEVTVAAATVDLLITFNFAVPIEVVVTGQRIPVVEFQAAQATGVVAEPAISASAAVEA